MNKRPIGIFDSGVGGLTVFKEIRNRFPFEDIVYFGDTARVPYGPKSKNTIIDYSVQNARFLLQKNVKVIIVACNTSSAQALPFLREKLSVPVIGVIQPGANTAVSCSQNGRIGVIGTEGTIKSKAYQQSIQNILPNSNVFAKSCPLFVSLVEEGWEQHKIAKLVTEEYLMELKDKAIDTLVLGCTHYPILKLVISEVMGKEVKLIDSAEAIAQFLEKNLPEPEKEQKGSDRFYVSDNEIKFKEIASRILEKEVDLLQKVKLGESWFPDL